MVLGYPALGVVATLLGLLGQAAAATITAFRPEGDGQSWLGLTADVVFAAAIMAAVWAAGSGDRGHMLIWLASGLATAQLLLLGRWLAARNLATPQLIFDDGAFWLLLGAGVIAGYWPLAIAFAAPLAAASLLISLWKRRDRKAV
jgi:hypothetical protein